MLILCEKPSVAAEFAKTLNCQARKGCFLDGANTTITYCVGHLFELLMPEEYRPEWKKWDINTLPIIPYEFKYKTITSSADQASVVLNLLRQNKNNEIIIATDAGREGELIARIVLHEAGLSDLSRCRRFWVSEALTPEVIRQGLESARPLIEYNLTAQQGYARQHADWLVGVNLSRYMSIGNHGVFSVGRVQSAVLAAVAIRNYQADHFIPTPYQELELHLKDTAGVAIKASLINPESKKTAFPPKDTYLFKALAYAREKGGDIQINAAITPKRKKPEKLLNLTALQKLAYKLYDYPPDSTLAAAQELYETHKCLSYPRTPSRVMGDNNVNLFMEKFDLLKSIFPEWSQFSDPRLITVANKHIFNSAALEDHHALIPLAPIPSEASDRERNIYNIIVMSFFTVCMPDMIWNEKQLLIKNGEYIYKTIIREIINEGWTRVQGKEMDSEAQQVPRFDEKNCRISSAEILDKQTSPPKEFRLDTLLAFMENPINGEERSSRLAGLGTPATRAEIIKTLFGRNYIVESKKNLRVTPKGLFLLKQLKSDDTLRKIADVGQTTEWEQQLQADPAAFEQSIIHFVRNCIKPKDSGERWEGVSAGICPLCGNKVLEGKRAWYCSAWNSSKPCKFMISKEVAGAKLAVSDIQLLLAKKKTPVKSCTSKKGKNFKTAFKLDNSGEIEFLFSRPKKKGAKGEAHE
jgi:DNA topoisomerase-3